jgi:acyl carrier protein
MEKAVFLEKICEVLGIDSLSDNNLTEEGAWDSIRKLSLIAMIDEEFGPDSIDDTIKQASSIKQILDSLQQKGFIANE